MLNYPSILRPYLKHTRQLIYVGGAGVINLVNDGDMEAVGVASWSLFNAAVRTKETVDPHSGTQCLRVARSTTNNPHVRQVILTSTVAYEYEGYARSDGSAIPRFTNGSGTALFIGTTATTWQLASGSFTADGTSPRWQATTSTGTQYCEFDDWIIWAA